MKVNIATVSRGVSGIIVFILWILLAFVYWKIRPQQLTSVKLPRACSSNFQVIEHGSAFVYSAYIDNRPARDLTSKPNDSDAVVLIFVYFLRTLDAQRKWKCLFWYEGQDKPVVTQIYRVTDLNSFSKLRFLVAMVICNLPKTPSDLILGGISLSSSGSNQTNFVCVADIRHSRSALSSESNPLANNSINPVPISILSAGILQAQSVSSKNETQEERSSASQPEQRYNVTFTVCTTPIHGNYYTTTDIVNFIEVSRIFGAERFIFYVDENIDPSIRYCLDSYRDRRIVEMYPFTPPVIDGLYYHGQILSINDCMYRTMYRTKYLINQDIDEVIVPLNASGWQTMLNDIHQRTGRNYAERIASYSFQNQFFPLEAPDDPAFGQMFLVKRYNIKTLLKAMKEAYVYPHDQRSKVMARPERILIWHVHLILEDNLIRRNDTIYHVSNDEALLHHYRKWSTNLNLTSETRMHKYASLITERIHFGMGLCSPID